MLDELKRAIESRLKLEIYYSPGSRVIEPHALGYSKDGKPLLRAFQTSGASASGEHEHWKLFRVDRIQNSGPNGQSFLDAREGYRKGDSAMKGGIIVQL
ncbi:MAG: WYL domain-containing protein [Proteobacteria bacterium]|nr:WYL domain-containing protein [Pseudomonadota bacterium]